MTKEVSKEAAVHHGGKDYVDPPPAPFLGVGELKLWSFYRALIFLYVTVATVIGHKKLNGADQCDGVGLLGIAWAFGGMIFILVYCTAGISGGHINPAVTFGLFLARKVSLIRAVSYIIAQCLGAISGVGLVKAFMKTPNNTLGGGANVVAPGYNTGTAIGAEIIGTFVLVYTISPPLSFPSAPLQKKEKKRLSPSKLSLSLTAAACCRLLRRPPELVLPNLLPLHLLRRRLFLPRSQSPHQRLLLQRRRRLLRQKPSRRLKLRLRKRGRRLRRRRNQR